jgi:hypothetical protein
MTREELVRAAEEANAETIRVQDDLGGLLHAAERRLEDAHKTISTLTKQREENRKCFVFAEGQVRGLRGLLEVTEYALDESVKLQSHYAGLLNMYDGGNRMTFATGQAWIERLKYLRDAKPHPDAEHAPQARDVL